jgi:hypothetical protein
MSEAKIIVPDNVKEALFTGDQRFATPTGGLVLGPGEHDLPLATPWEHCEGKIEYRVPLPSSTGEATRIPLVRPEADRWTRCWAELRGDAATRPLQPKGWETTTVDAAALWEWASDLANDPANAGADSAPGLVVYANGSPTNLEWRTEPTTALASLVVPRALVQESMTTAGRRRGRLLAVIARHRANTVELVVPPNCTLVEAFVDNQPAPPSFLQDGGRVVYRLQPPEDKPCSLEVRYEARSPAIGAFQSARLDVPRFTETAAVDQVRWQVQLASDVLPMQSGGEGPGAVRWSFGAGFLRPPTSVIGSFTSDAAVRDWLRANGTELNWPTNGWFKEDGKRWTSWSFSMLASLDPLQFFAIRESFWVLLCSTAALVACFAVARAPGPRRATFLAGMLVLGAGVGVVVPDWAPWIWFGAQWGFYLGALILLAPLLQRPLPLWRLWGLRGGKLVAAAWNSGSTRIPAPRSGSSLARMNATAAEKPASSGVNPLGSTLDR